MVNSQCSGIYKKCLNIKITNACPGSCYFCIERYGYKPNMAPVTQIVEKANTLEDYQTVLILGGEPFTYPHLLELLQGLRKKEIYVTTNGGSFTNADIPSMSKYITGLNISIHSYDESENSAILKTKVDFHALKEAIACFQSYGVPIRFNTILLADGICSKEKMKRMLEFCREMQVPWIRFSELQFETRGFVFAKDCFDGIHTDPYHDGCNQDFEIDGLHVTVRQSCGIVNTCKSFPRDAYCRENKADSLVMYPSGEVFPGWLVPKEYRIRNTEPCEKVIECL